MKKILALVLALVMVLGLLSGCGGAKENKLVVYSPHDADPLNAGVALFQAAYPDIISPPMSAPTTLSSATLTRTLLTCGLANPPCPWSSFTTRL